MEGARLLVSGRNLPHRGLSALSLRVHLSCGAEGGAQADAERAATRAENFGPVWAELARRFCALRFSLYESCHAVGWIAFCGHRG